METLIKEPTIAEIISTENSTYVKKKLTVQEDLMEYYQRLNLRLVIQPDKNNTDNSSEMSPGNPILGSSLKPRNYGGVEKQRNMKGGVNIYERRKSVY